MVAGAARLLAAAAVLRLLPGCAVVVASTTNGSELPEAGLVGLRDGLTTRAQVLAAFGPPTRLATRGAGEDAGGRELFEPFSAHAPSPEDVVYRYEASLRRTSTSELGALKSQVSQSTTSTWQTDELWLLLDGRTGRLRAHVHRRAGSPPPAPGKGGEP